MAILANCLNVLTPKPFFNTCTQDKANTLGNQQLYINIITISTTVDNSIDAKHKLTGQNPEKFTEARRNQSMTVLNI